MVLLHICSQLKLFGGLSLFEWFFVGCFSCFCFVVVVVVVLFVCFIFLVLEKEQTDDKNINLG